MSLRATGIPICTDTTFLVGNLQLHCQFIRSDNFRAVTRTDGMLIPVSSPVMGSLKEPLNLAENTEFFRRFLCWWRFREWMFLFSDKDNLAGTGGTTGPSKIGKFASFWSRSPKPHRQTHRLTGVFSDKSEVLRLALWNALPLLLFDGNSDLRVNSDFAYEFRAGTKPPCRLGNRCEIATIESHLR